MAVATAAALTAEELPVAALKRLSLEELAQLEVTTVERRGEPLALTEAAVYILTAEDIERLGTTTIAESLRYVPGMQVARVDAHNWAISARGFNDLFANKLLVLMDGRSVYTPLYSGVYWQYQDVLLQDLDRIEIVRGPGATVWGANAVNGVINVLTKPASETQGLLVSAGGGDYETVVSAARYGGRINDSTAYRVYAKYVNRDNFPLANGDDANDRWWLTQGGFRVDWEPSGESTFTLQGDVFGTVIDSALFRPVLIPPTYRQYTEYTVTTVGGNIVGRWVRQLGNGSELQLQTFYQRNRQDSPDDFVIDEQQFDVDLQHSFPLGEHNELMWGLTYRLTSDEFIGHNNTRMDPVSRTTDLVGAFVQDRIEIVPERLRAVIGTKIEHNDYSGMELQPGLRLSWTPDERHTVWASVARAVRTPSRAEHDVVTRTAILPPVMPGMPPSVITATGSDDVDSEELLAFELGYRVRPMTRLSIDVALFLNEYDDLVTASPGAPDFSTLPDYINVPMSTANGASGESFGAEAAVSLQINDWWRLRTGYTWLVVNTDGESILRERANPTHQAFALSQMDLPHDLTLDVGYRFVDRLEAYNVPAYSEIDARLAWRPRPGFELALVGHNLLDDRHPEFGGSQYTGAIAAEVPRSFYAIVTWRY